MGLIKQLFPPAVKFTPASAEVNWTRINTLVHGPGASQTETHDSNSAVFACLMAIATAYPEPPLCVYHQVKADRSDKMPESPLQALLDRPTPSGELSIDEILFWTAWSKHADGNAYWLKVRSGDAVSGNVVQLWPISPTLIRPVTEKGSGDWISYYEYQISPGKIVQVPVQNVIHFRLGLDDRDMRKGLSPLKSLLREISTDEEADKFVAALLKNYAVPGLVVTPTADNELDSDDADEIADKLRRKFGSDNRGNIAVLSKDSKVQPFGFSPKDLDMSILHRIPEERISAVMGVPAIIAGLGAGLDRATYNNSRELNEMFTERKLVPNWRADAKKLNTSLKPDFSGDPNIYIDFDLTNVRALQEDEDKKYTRLQKAVGRPWMTRNEARTDTGLDPKPEWDQEDLVTAPQQPDNSNDKPNDKPADKPAAGEKAFSLELDRWQRKALNRLRDGRSAGCEFDSPLIPPSIAGAIQGALEMAETETAVKAVFANATAWEAYP